MQITFPAQMLSVHLAEISHKERIFLAGVTGVRIDALDALQQRLANQRLCIRGFTVADIGSRKVLFSKRLLS